MSWENEAPRNVEPQASGDMTRGDATGGRSYGPGETRIGRPAEHASTGHPAVDAALRAMANAADLPPTDQIAQYEATHRILSETLATIDEG